MHTPLMAATTGLGEFSNAAISTGKRGSRAASAVPNSFTSAPPEKARSLPVTTTAVTAGSASAWSSDCRMPLRSAAPRPLTGG
jgi:hypothetical protein